MKQTIGRFLLQPNKSFPIDCETLDAMQTNIALLQVLGNIAGNKTILSGCESEQNGTRRKAGYVFVKTKDFPEGEVLYWEGGNATGGMYVNQEVVQVTVQGYEYPQAYTVRSLVAGVGSENFSWSDFKTFKTPRELDEHNAKQDADIAALTPPPLGIVQIWAGHNLPDNYALCDGAQLRQEDYPELFSVIGTAFNATADHANNPQTTSPGYFRLPDLRGRFIVGESSVEEDYKVKGSTGGKKKHQLTIDEMPSHNHKYWTWETGGSDRNRFSGKSNNDNPNKQGFDTSSVGSNKPHENRPPYYTLAYIMRLR